MILFSWDHESLNAVVTALNKTTTEFPSWIRARPPYITGERLKQDIISYLADRAGISHHPKGFCFGTAMLATGSLSAFASVIAILVEIESHKCIQQCLEAVSQQNYVVKLGYLTQERLHDIKGLPLELERFQIKSFFA